MLKKVLIAVVITAMLISLVACSQKQAVKEGSATVDKKEAISIKYAGNSCFWIVFPDGTKLMTDPYGKKYANAFAPFPKLDPDFVTLSHMHEDHIAGLYELDVKPQLIRPVKAVETTTVGGVTVTGYSTKHVANMGDNTVFIYEMNGLKIVHMGETDHIDDQEAQKAIKGADVLLVYAGQYDKTKNKEIFQFAKDMDIKVLIPQHFSVNPKNPWYGAPTEEEIIKDIPEGYKQVYADELFVTKDMGKQFMFLKPIGLQK